jgi:hypothetical protein
MLVVAATLNYVPLSEVLHLNLGLDYGAAP